MKQSNGNQTGAVAPLVREGTLLWPKRFYRTIRSRSNTIITTIWKIDTEKDEANQMRFSTTKQTTKKACSLKLSTNYKEKCGTPPPHHNTSNAESTQDDMYKMK
jgi:hypothetical protein